VSATSNPRGLKILVSVRPEQASLARLHALNPLGENRLVPPLTAPGQTLPEAVMHDAEVLFCERMPANFGDLRAVRWIQLASAGYSDLFGLPVVERGIRISNAVGVFDVPVAEWNMLMLLNSHRHLPELMANQHARRYDRDRKFQAELRGSIVGLYGYGGIARETARLAKCFGLEVWALTRDGTLKPRTLNYRVAGTGDPEGRLPDRVFGPEQREEFLRGVDFLVIAVPLTAATRGLLGEKELRMLKRSAVLINAARAHIIDEDAYMRCLREGWIRGAALDSHYQEPLPDGNPTWSLPNLMLTPHISGSSESPHYLDRSYDVFLQNLERYLAGEPLLNALSEAQLKGA
jgi:phosphoglycerate dehydrogenase-like enzyme